MPGSAFSVFLALLSQSLQRPLCLVTSVNERAEQIRNDLDFLGLPHVFHFPEDETLPYELEEPAVEILARQIETLGYLSGCYDHRHAPHAGIVLAPLESVLSKTVPADRFRAHALRIRQGDSVPTDGLARSLSEAGYIRVPIVESHGEFALRGGIVDVYPLDQDYPVRLDFFGEQIESIRQFDPATQRSLKREPLKEVVLLPAGKNQLVRRCLEHREALAPWASLLPPDTVFVLDEPERFAARAAEFWKLIQRQYAEQTGKSDTAVPAPEELYEPLDSFLARVHARPPVVEHHVLEIGGGATRGEADEPARAAQSLQRPESSRRSARGRTLRSVNFQAAAFDAVPPNFDTFLDIIREHLARRFFVVIACDNDGQVQRFEEMLGERHVECATVSAKSPWRPGRSNAPAPVVLTVGPLHAGCVWPDARLLLLTDREVFGRYKHRHMFRKIYRGTPVVSVADIARNDYVVHVDHGIGRFLGLRRQMVDGRMTDLIEILYQDGDKLLVPVEKIQYVQKYSAVEGTVPSLDKLGGKRWIARKRKSQESIEKMAEELLDLYARRATVKARPCDADTVWQTEFEASFLYQETPDQLKAIEDVKDDLRRPIPMDRLVCGDVGYGKTEVAMRAAFKMVQEGRQVAVLVPTTILAQQHFNTFRERFADYDVRIEMLSRFRSAREQREILRRLRLGDVQIIIGTHRLLSKDVEFADLGLLVVDEEHRFGVRAKEKLKQMRTSVHVLTLTATPIPRTLHMALSGLRDMSVIHTPPADRLPIRTHVIHFEHDRVQEALLRELNRGGQVFFVHNRVQNIELVARRLREIVPHARIAIAHGQMDEHTLERIMLDFVAGKYDILVSTTIIESGLDIPNVNTILINRADALGLAQLYQLRGRVGRSARQAYAYLIVPHGEAITDAAVRRLAAIQEFVELGAGFQIALRDMEIRGTGNLLGREQHGAMVAIGFELYCDLLQKAVRKLKGEAAEAEIEAEVKWPIDAYLPESYIPLESQRVGFYKQLAGVRTLRAVADIEEEIRDRYGKPPEAVEALIALAAIRVAASLCRIARVAASPQSIRLETPDEPRDLLSRLERLRHNRPALQSVRTWNGAVEIVLKPPGSHPLSRVHEALALLRQLVETGT
ncbi:MAG: transcription-repair coupling factor [Candidatus Sumerlaeia bacterium]|nr:transcription-repair coupling factor [Candidatus Sumerlaeia bacterium]